MIVSLCTLCSVCVVMCLASHTMGRIFYLRCSFHILYMYLHLPYIQLYTRVLMHTGFMYACYDVIFLYFIYVDTFTLYTIMRIYTNVHLFIYACQNIYICIYTPIYVLHICRININLLMLSYSWVLLQVPSYWTQHNFGFSRLWPSSKSVSYTHLDVYKRQVPVSMIIISHESNPVKVSG